MAEPTRRRFKGHDGKCDPACVREDCNPTMVCLVPSSTPTPQDYKRAHEIVSEWCEHANPESYGVVICSECSQRRIAEARVEVRDQILEVIRTHDFYKVAAKQAAKARHATVAQYFLNHKLREPLLAAIQEQA